VDVDFALQGKGIAATKHPANVTDSPRIRPNHLIEQQKNPSQPTPPKKNFPSLFVSYAEQLVDTAHQNPEKIFNLQITR
jgi:hypothetical protein